MQGNMDLDASINARIARQSKKKFAKEAKKLHMKEGPFLRLIIELVNAGKIEITTVKQHAERATA